MAFRLSSSPPPTTSSLQSGGWLRIQHRKQHVAIPRMSIFRELGGTGRAPWEVGHTQPTVAKLVEQGLFKGSILDIGCGPCFNAVHIAKSTGLKVTSFDFVPRVVEDARERVALANADVDVFQADIFDLDASPIASLQFDTVLDAAVFHGWDDPTRILYRDVLAKVVKPGGTYVMLVFSDKCPVYPGQPFPRRVSKKEIEELFTRESGWSVESVEDGVYQLVMVVDGRIEDCPAYVGVVRRLGE